MDTECLAVAHRYQQFLGQPPANLIVLTLDQIVERWQPLLSSPPQQRWLEAFRTRYLSLNLSGA